MATVNKVILIGNLGRDPDLRGMNNGGTVTQLTVATSRKYRDSSGQVVSETEWHRVVTFARLAEFAKQYLHKGSLVYIEGRIRTRKYTDKDGGIHHTTEVIAETLFPMDKRSPANTEQTIETPDASLEAA